MCWAVVVELEVLQQHHSMSRYEVKDLPLYMGMY